MSMPMAVIVAGILCASAIALQGAPASIDDTSKFVPAVRVHDRLPPGHPPIPSRRLPDGHPPIHPALPEGHPPIPWLRQGCPWLDGEQGYGGGDVVRDEIPEVVST
jgi:hypothetical protein